MKPASKRQNPQAKPSKDTRGTITVRVVKSKKKAMSEKQKTKGIEAAVLYNEEDHSCRALPICNATIRGTHFSKKVIAETPRLQSEMELKPDPRYRLQLFPIDDITCKGLLQDGLNPHLELILGERKKISSVVKHLDRKWGSSRVAIGEFKLFPFEARLETVDDCVSWSLKDIDMNASDVYRFLGNPAVFRLRYGWFPSIQSRACEVHYNGNQGIAHPEYSETACTESDHVLKTSDGSLCVFSDRHLQSEKTETEMEKDTDNDNTFSWIDEGLTNLSFGDLLDKVATLDDNEANQLPQEHNPADGLTNISFSDLLDRVGTSDGYQVNQLSAENNSGSQQLPFSCDSFDAAIAAHLARQQSQIQPATRLSSILDAEETCHHFPLLGNSSKRQVPAPPVEPLACSKTQECASVPEGKEHIADIAYSQSSDESDMQSDSQDDACLEVNNDHSMQGLFQNFNENSIGLSGIKWDSVGHLDMSLPSKLPSGGESIDLSNLLANS